MTLKRLATLLPGSTTLMLILDTLSWGVTAAEVAGDKNLSEALVVSAAPLGAFFMEVSIKLKEVTK